MKRIAVAWVLLLAFVCSFGCGGKEIEPAKPEQDRFALSVSGQTMTGKIYEPVRLHRAEATDEDGADLSGKVRADVLYIPENQLTTGLGNGAEFVPVKAGSYLVTYTVVSGNGAVKRVQADLNVAQNAEFDASRVQNKTHSGANWVLDGRTSRVTEQGLVIGQGNREAAVGDLASVAYSRAKVDDEIVKLNFTIHGGFGNQMYVLGAKASAGSKNSAPSITEAAWPQYYFIRIMQTKISIYGSIYGGNEMLMGELERSLYDGENHSFAYVFDDNGAAADSEDATVSCRIWIDTDVKNAPTFSADIKASTLGYNGAGQRDPNLPDLYGPESAGWAFVGAARNVVNDDYMLLQGFSIGDECFVEPPFLYVDEPEGNFLKGTELKLPEAIALDSATGVSLSDRVTVRLTDPQGKTSVVSGGVTPKSSGKYSALYSVSDASGNRTDQRVEFFVLNALDDRTAPEISTGVSSVEAVVGRAFDLPEVTAADGLDGDLSAAVEIASDGPEGRLIPLDAETYTPYLARDFNLHYTVKDFNGNAAEKTVAVHVSPDGGTGDLTANAGDWFSANNESSASVFSLGGKDGSSLTYRRQMIYEQKVSLKIGFGDPFIPIDDRGEGVKALLISLRGGFENYGYMPGTPQNSAFTWPNNFSILISSAGVHLFLDNKQLTQSYVDFASVLANGEHVVTYQVRDLPGNLVQLIVKIDGVAVLFPGGDSSTGAYYLNRADNASYSRSTWLNLFTYGTYPAGKPSAITVTGVRIDGQEIRV